MPLDPAAVPAIELLEHEHECPAGADRAGGMLHGIACMQRRLQLD